jgi:FkbM family methyltransferase
MLIEPLLSSPKPLPRLARRVHRRFTVEWRKRTYVRAEELETVATLMHGDSRGDVPVSVHVRSLGDAAVRLRPGTTDSNVLWATFVGVHHLPPPEIDRRSVRVIWDLGANIGLTMAHFAVRYPQARISGVELDEVTAAAARLNLEPWSKQCKLIRGAVWHEDGSVPYACERGNEEAAHIVAGSAADVTGSAPAFSLNTLFADCPRVDFVKFDIEGAEQSVLTRSTEWAARVRSVKVEVHPPYTMDDCARDLRALGFRVRPEFSHWACLVGVR